ncbi:histone deacetylase HOS3 [Fusarium austroafricanum]|uniref:Histone deacetylase HOS3 n=1 Tax=Fusarium austroafricanum TaxID=2364996 RepID=A0A8H4KCE2_9HYPO|nr:histone deacetylase HOS3 [Fusarium austroafricanum]
MASRPSLPLRRQSSARSLKQPEHDDLAQTLNQLTISTSPGRSPSRLSEPASPFRPSGRRASQSPAPNARARAPSRSPSQGRDPSRDTPSLLRKASMNSLRSSNGIGPGSTPSRRSSMVHQISPTQVKSPLSATPHVLEKPRPTAISIAHDNLSDELQAHHGSTSTRPTQMTVVLNDAVYGHRFSRPRTSRAALGTIVERPERIKAAVLGISTAYVRLGGRHSEGEYPLHPKREAEDIHGIPFKIHKTERTLSLLSPAVVNVHGTKWMEELKMMCDAAESKLAMGGKELQRPQMNRGAEKADKFHEGDLYLCSESLNAMEGALGAVCEAIDTVFGSGPQRAFVGVRPPGHHCSASYPSGFCWVNNVHVGIMHAALTHGLTHAAIIDFDLHHGDGSQAITWQHNSRGNAAAKNAAAWKKTSIGYFSLHDINSYPCEMGDEEKVRSASICIDNAHGQTVWNVHLEPWKSEEEFWQLYETRYSVLLGKVRNYLKNQAERLREANLPPRAAIFLSAGFDASEWESAGMQRHKVNVPTEFYARIAQDVVKLAAEESLEVDGRIISVLEGGYSDRALCSGILSHLSGLAGDQTYAQEPDNVGRLGVEMGQKIGSLEDEMSYSFEQKPALDSIHTYDPSWWSLSHLDELEALLEDTSAPKKPQSAALPTYFAPTQASTAKVADPIKMRRSLSSLGSSMSRPPSPPPPEVPWAIAAHELSKLLIPSTRQTDSCKPEELNAEASKARRDRHSILMGIDPKPPAGPASRPTSRMSLRERRAKPAPPPEPVEKAPTSRRRTMGAATISSDKAVARGVPSRTNSDEPTARRTSRRLSEIPASLATTDVPEVAGQARTVPNSPMNTKTTAASSSPAKKARNPAAPRKEPAAPRASRGTKKATASTTAGSSRPATATQKARSPAKPSKKDGASSSAAGDDMDSITTGMKKIRINLITQSQKDAKERARLEAEKAKGKESSINCKPQLQKPASGSSSAQHSPKTTTHDQPSPTQPAPTDNRNPTPPTSSSGLVTPLQEQYAFDSGAPVTQLVSPPLSSPAIPSVSVHPSTDADDMFIPYQPEGPAPEPVAQSEPLKWLPPNVPTPSEQTPVATPSPAKKNNLFQYTAGIPFAPRPGQQTHDVKSEPVEEIPETP